MRSFLLAPALVAALFLPSISAHADEMKTFAFSGSYAYNSTTPAGYANGTVVIDTTTGQVTFESYTATTMSFNGVNPENLSGTSGGGFTQIYFDDNDDLAGVSPTYIEYWLPTSLVNFSGGAICSVDNPCPGYESLIGQHQGDEFINGNLDLVSVAATPEPSSLALLGTGALGILGLVRRKLA